MLALWSWSTIGTFLHGWNTGKQCDSWYHTTLHTERFSSFRRAVQTYLDLTTADALVSQSGCGIPGVYVLVIRNHTMDRNRSLLLMADFLSLMNPPLFLQPLNSPFVLSASPTLGLEDQLELGYLYPTVQFQFDGSSMLPFLAFMSLYCTPITKYKISPHCRRSIEISRGCYPTLVNHLEELPNRPL